MREILRLVTLAVVTIIVVVAALFISGRTPTLHTDGMSGLVDGEAARYPARLEEGASHLKVPMPFMDRWHGLQGFPSQTTLRFRVPDDATAAQLQLEVESWLVDAGNGLLRVYINDVQRDSVPLAAGRHRHALTYNLSPADYPAGWLVLRLEDEGTTGNGSICPTNSVNMGSAVEVLPETALVVEFDKAPNDPNIIAAGLAEPLLIRAESDAMLTAWTSQWLSRQGVDAKASAENDFNVALKPHNDAHLLAADPGRLDVFGLRGITELARLRGAATPSTEAQTWPLPVSALTPDLATHTFRGSTRWLLDYKLSDLPNGRAPGALSLRLKPAQLQPGGLWALRVTLNGDLLEARNFDGDIEMMDALIALPVARQKSRNLITITLVDQTPNRSICRAGPEAAAQLVASSFLLPSSGPVTDEQTLIEMLAAEKTVTLNASGEPSPGTLSEIAGMLELLLPLSVKPAQPQDTPRLSISAFDFNQTPSQQVAGTTKEGFVVFKNPRSTSGDLSVMRLGAQSDAKPGRGLIVTW